MECIYHSDFWYLHQNRFPGRSLCYIDDSAFHVAVVDMIAPVVAAVDYYSYVQDNHAVLLYLHLTGSFCPFSH
jgi:hypothetical protein